MYRKNLARKVDIGNRYGIEKKMANACVSVDLFCYIEISLRQFIRAVTQTLTMRRN